MRLQTLALFIGFSWLCLEGASVIELQNGATVEGELAVKRGDRVFVDLGFDLLEVPRSAITAIRGSGESKNAGGDPQMVDSLYQVVPNRNNQSIRDWVDSLGEAVTLVQTPTGLGSGFVIHPDGYVVTNNHVIAGEHRISVTVFKQENSEFKRENYNNVRIVANSAELDLALLKIESDEGGLFEVVPLAALDNALREGQTVFAVGSPLGLDRTVSEGIISVANRVIGGRLYIQTTTQINPGNSGGPLFNLKGEVVGVNNMKIAAIGAEGLGFSISSRIPVSYTHLTLPTKA